MDVFKNVQNYIILALIGGAFTLYKQVQVMQITVDNNKDLRRELCEVVLQKESKLSTQLKVSICVGDRK